MTQQFILGPDDVRRTAAEHAAAFPPAAPSAEVSEANPAEAVVDSAVEPATGSTTLKLKRGPK